MRCGGVVLIDSRELEKWIGERTIREKRGTDIADQIIKDLETDSPSIG